MIKLILFDLDGVLVDACEWHFHALNMSLEKNCNISINRRDHENKFNGSPTSVKLDILYKEGKIKQKDKQKIWNDKQSFTVEAIKKFSKIDNQKIKMHKDLIARKIKIGCVTNSIRKTANLMLQKTGQINYMSLIITNEDVIKPKPDPECYLNAINYFQVSPKETLIIEDSDKGYKSAIDSGSHVLKVKGTDEVNLQNILCKITTIEKETK